jgi:hypothetical protein
LVVIGKEGGVGAAQAGSLDPDFDHAQRRISQGWLRDINHFNTSWGDDLPSFHEYLQTKNL